MRPDCVLATRLILSRPVGAVCSMMGQRDRGFAESCCSTHLFRISVSQVQRFSMPRRSPGLAVIRSTRFAVPACPPGPDSEPNLPTHPPDATWRATSAASSAIASSGASPDTSISIPMRRTRSRNSFPSCHDQDDKASAHATPQSSTPPGTEAIAPSFQIATFLRRNPISTSWAFAEK